MQKTHKRKQQSSQSSSIKSARWSKTIIVNSKGEPYPDHLRPTPDECRAVRDTLLANHGFPKEFIKYRRKRLVVQDSKNGDKNVILESSVSSEALGDEGDDDVEPKETVLDGLVSTILSQNTTDVNSQRAFASLKSSFPTWEDVLAAEKKQIEDAIRCGGLAPTKASCIKGILESLLAKRGKLCLEYLRGLSIEEIKAELSHFKGIGPKTVACVLMFQLQQDDFPVDTHIFQISKSIGWLPAMSDLKKAYIHLNSRIPDDLKFDLNCLLFTHGKICRRCSKKGDSRSSGGTCSSPCPLLAYCNDAQKPNEMLKSLDSVL
ncbi:hypothetical protein M9H77_04777 [Catharanthus roseus]|uniref:Uncharacterized protein n=1 Tax=Catharanthus roseus TaxID=4058 RepID=A0ACC0CFI1_CATRO|nr:hypothetical protein M9H77_04777 [Catharanthus roseus]